MAIDPYLGFKPDPKPPAPKEKDAVVATPEGDNEFSPDEPLKPLPEGAEQESGGSAPDAYKWDKGSGQ